MKVISILLALINSLTGGLLIFSCFYVSEPLGWFVLKVGGGILAIYFGMLTFKDSMQPISQRHLVLSSLFLVIVGISVVSWGIHWSIISGDIQNIALLFGGSLFTQGVTSILGTEIS
jgi:hypothetical protein